MTRAVDLAHVSSYITRLKQPPPLPLFRAALAWTLILILRKETAVNPCTLTRREHVRTVGGFCSSSRSNVDFTALKVFRLSLSDRKVFRRRPQVHDFTVLHSLGKFRFLKLDMFACRDFGEMQSDYFLITFEVHLS